MAHQHPQPYLIIETENNNNAPRHAAPAAPKLPAHPKQDPNFQYQQFLNWLGHHHPPGPDHHARNNNN